MTVWYQTIDKKIGVGELIDEDDTSALVKVLIDGEGNRISHNLYSLVSKSKIISKGEYRNRKDFRCSV